MPTRRITVHATGQDKQEFIRIANDVWARLQDASPSLSIWVTWEADDVTKSELNADYHDRYRKAPRWGDR